MDTEEYKDVTQGPVVRIEHSNKYTPLAANCDLSEWALLEAIDKIIDKIGQHLFMQPVILFIGKSGYRDAIKVALTTMRPATPYINLQIDPSLDWDEWYVEHNGIAFGSKGA